MIPDYPWFGPKHTGWGWAPVSWEGKVLSFVVIAGLIVICMAFGRSKRTAYLVVGILAAFMAVVICTGTGPG